MHTACTELGIAFQKTNDVKYLNPLVHEYETERALFEERRASSLPLLTESEEDDYLAESRLVALLDGMIRALRPTAYSTLTRDASVDEAVFQEAKQIVDRAASTG